MAVMLVIVIVVCFVCFTVTCMFVFICSVVDVFGENRFISRHIHEYVHPGKVLSSEVSAPNLLACFAVSPSGIQDYRVCWGFRHVASWNEKISQAASQNQRPTTTETSLLFAISEKKNCRVISSQEEKTKQPKYQQGRVKKNDSPVLYI